MAYGVSLLLASNLLPAFMKRYGAPINIALFYWVTGPNLPHILRARCHRNPFRSKKRP